MKKIIYIQILLFVQVICFGQQKSFSIKGIIYDSATHKPIPNVSIRTNETDIAVQSNSLGYFSLSVEKIPAVLFFSHLGFKSKTIDISSLSNTYLEIILQEKITELSEVSVTINKPKPLTEGQPLYIKDFDFINDTLFVLAYKQKMFSKAYLVMMDLNGDTICSVHIKEPKSLYKNCLDNNYIITKSFASQIIIDSNTIHFLDPEDVEKFEEMFQPIVEELNNKFFFQKYYYNDQLLQYYYYDKHTRKSKELQIIANEQNLFMMRDRSRIIVGSDDPEIQERFEDLAFYQPVFAPLVKINDTICIFNYADSQIEFYSDSCLLIREIPVFFQNDHFWRREIFVDDVKGKVYALFRKEGISTLKEIDLRNGTLKNSVVIPEFPFIEKIKVHDDNVYFLYTEHGFDEEYKRLYKMKI
jgi:hypothetical protein